MGAVIKRAVLAVIAIAALASPAAALGRTVHFEGTVVQGVAASVPDCQAPPFGHGMHNDRGAPLEHVSAHNMSCRAAVRGIQRRNLTRRMVATPGFFYGFRTPGFGCRVLHKFEPNPGEITGETIRCTSGERAFRFTWAT